jgi:hypothetical protein
VAPLDQIPVLTEKTTKKKLIKSLNRLKNLADFKANFEIEK